MDSTLGIFQGLLGALDHDRSAYSDGTFGFRPPYQERNTFFKVYTGLDHGDFKDAGGDLPDARLFDLDGQFIGMVADPGNYVGSGKSSIFWAGSKGQPVYTLFSANENAQCISFVSAVWPGRSGHYSWVGDWGSECAGDDPSMATWFFGKIAVPGTKYWPNCLWIDLNGGAPATGFQVNWLDMKPDVNDARIGQQAKSMCQTPSFHLYQHYDPAYIIHHHRDHNNQQPGRPPVLKRSETAPPRKRSKPKLSAAEAKLAFEEKYRNKLVVDDVPAHNAHALCESASSAGPSFVNPEHGYFCDMQTKTIHPVCKEQDGKDVCFDMEQRELGKST
ncbi:hypothetical protein INS49_002824 [Diaporthe citri]|uniref:uncharacterized protein n=1 Tax=Diaporthe citri TaxID=83186 RepID=UPI001C819684|nr:uncharacterized protein INS49_002824 [Diaporthe citri]KAG6368611.1 hypothetical protein INS49_002824 [Diaporthe citri]